MRAVRTALSWMTVLPLGSGAPPDTGDAGRAITALPLVGLVCGAVAVATGHGLLALGASSLLAASLGVVVLLLLTRGMHVDALADTVDALGSYAPRERALEIMGSGTVGPMGVAAVCAVVVVEVAALAQLLAAGEWVGPVAALVVSRCLPATLCRRGVPAAKPGGFGADVAGSQGPAGLAAVAVTAVCGGVLLAGDPGTHDGPGSAVAGAVVAVLLLVVTAASSRHLTRRLGGISGDVLGAAVELGTAAALVAAALLHAR